MSLDDIIVIAGAVFIGALAILVAVLERKPRVPTDDTEPTEGDGRWTVEIDGRKFWSGKEGAFDRYPSVEELNASAAKAVEEEGKRPLIRE